MFSCYYFFQNEYQLANVIIIPCVLQATVANVSSCKPGLESGNLAYDVFLLCDVVPSIYSSASLFQSQYRVSSIISHIQS